MTALLGEQRGKTAFHHRLRGMTAFNGVCVLFCVLVSYSASLKAANVWVCCCSLSQLLCWLLFC
jgi:hypothetical protein